MEVINLNDKKERKNNKKNIRIGEENYNTFGSKMIISDYRNARDIDVYFPKYNYTNEHNTYDNFVNGSVKCPMEPRVYGHGYIGVGIYNYLEHKDIYSRWTHMLARCYNKKYHVEKPSYIDCIVCQEWLNFQVFSEWFEKNYYEIEGEVITLDKDLFGNGKTKIYSPATCCFLPIKINSIISSTNNKKKLINVADEYIDRIPNYIYQKLIEL